MIDVSLVRRLTFLKEYRIVRKAGEGGQATVFNARRRDNGRMVAIKIFDMKMSTTARSDFHQEVTYLQLCRRIPGVVLYLGHEVDSSDNYGAVVTEWIGGGCVADMTHINKYANMRKIAGFLWRTLTAMHSLGIFHGDLKPENILVRNRNRDGEIFCLCDMGLARSTNPTVRTTLCGTLDFLPPETVTEPQPASDDRIDTWMFAVVLCDLVSDTVPFFAPSFGETIDKIKNADPDLSDCALTGDLIFHSFLELCLDKNHTRRPHLTDLAHHPFIRSCLDPRNNVPPLHRKQRQPLAKKVVLHAPPTAVAVYSSGTSALKLTNDTSAESVSRSTVKIAPSDGSKKTPPRRSKTRSREPFGGRAVVAPPFTE